MATFFVVTADGVATHPVEAVAGSPLGAGLGGVGASNAIRVVVWRNGAARVIVLLHGLSLPVLVNGAPVRAGIRVLQHKDELAIGQTRLFFSAESTPTIETYTHSGTRRRPRCPTCRNEIFDAQAVVRCPGCSRIYHQISASASSPEKPCWTYSPTCGLCGHPTSLSGESIWRPDADLAS